MRSHAIRVQLEQTLKKTDPSPFRSSLLSASPETVPTGIRELDRLIGGLPRGRITEILGSPSSGRTSLMLSVLAEMTQRGEVCGVIDPPGAFDPTSAAQFGTDLKHVLWVCTGRQIDPALKTTDLLLHGGGFGFIGVDLSEFSPSAVGRVPLSSWFRLQRAVEHTPTILMFLNADPTPQTAALVVRLKLEDTAWSPHLLHGLYPSAEVVRSKVHSGSGWRGARERFELQLADRLAAISSGGRCTAGDGTKCG